jgi:aryl-alcohol dehydrogenase-like predicted oxidoreductase
MQLRRLGNTGLYVSELCLGTMTFGMGLDEDTSLAILERYLDGGGNFIDTANVYGRGLSEERLGKFLKGRRHSVILATKVRGAMSDAPLDRGLSRRHIFDAVDASLQRLQTDYIDLYQTHYWDNWTDIEETLDALNDLIRMGKVRYIGASNIAGWQLMKALGVSERYGWAKYTTLQPEYSLVVRDIERELVPASVDANIAGIPYSPLAGGVLSGKYRRDQAPPPGSRGDMVTRTPMAAMWQARMNERTFAILDEVEAIASETGKSVPQVALRWLLDRPSVVSPIIGASRPEQIDDNLGASGWRLSAEQTKRLDDVSALPLGYPYEFIQRLNAVGPAEAAAQLRKQPVPA